MIEYVQGDILQSDCEAVVNTVNVVGVMGRGLALQFKQAFPLMFAEYQRICQLHELTPGRLHVYENSGKPRFIINFATKNHWHNPSRYEWIYGGLICLAKEVINRDIKSIAIPALGCSNGKLHYPTVKKAIESWHGAFCPDRLVKLYEPEKRA